jgi:hypothetical protein
MKDRLDYIHSGFNDKLKSRGARLLCLKKMGIKIKKPY